CPFGAGVQLSRVGSAAGQSLANVPPDSRVLTTPREDHRPGRTERPASSGRTGVWSADARGPMPGELVARGGLGAGVLGGALAGQLREGALDLAPDAADRDAEHAL